MCQQFLKKDNRIRYFRQENNKGPNWNFHFILQKAEGEYFFWTSVDDKILTNYIEKNIVVLEKNKNIISSTSQVKPYGEKTDYLSKNYDYGFLENMQRKNSSLSRFFPSCNFSNNPIRGNWLD